MSALCDVLRQQELLDALRGYAGPTGGGTGFRTTSREVNRAVVSGEEPRRRLAAATALQEVLRQPELLGVIGSWVGPSPGGDVGLHATGRGVQHAINRGLQELPQVGRALRILPPNQAYFDEEWRLTALISAPGYISTTP